MSPSYVEALRRQAADLGEGPEAEEFCQLADRLEAAMVAQEQAFSEMQERLMNMRVMAGVLQRLGRVSKSGKAIGDEKSK